MLRKKSYSFYYLSVMNRHTMIRLIQITFRFILGGMLIFAGILKIQDNTSLFESVAYITWLPIFFKSLIIDFLPWIEILVGSLLLFFLFDKWSISATLLIYLSFFIFAVWGQSTGLEIDCGCFGDLDDKSFIGNLLGSELGWKMTIRNFIFTCMSLFLYFQPSLKSD